MKKNKYGMPPPRTRGEFEYNISLIFEDASRKIDSKQFDPFFVQRTLPQLNDIKFLPNGRINFNSVDESIRLQANMQNWMQFMPPPALVKKEDEEPDKSPASDVLNLKIHDNNKRKRNKNKGTKRTNKQIVERWKKRTRSKRTRIKRKRKK